MRIDVRHDEHEIRASVGDDGVGLDPVAVRRHARASAAASGCSPSGERLVAIGGTLVGRTQQDRRGVTHGHGSYAH